MSQAYRIEILSSAAREIRTLPVPSRLRVDACILGLAANPRPPGVKKLQGTEDLWRIRAGDYRIVYRIRDRVLCILIVRVAQRRDVYRKR